MICLNIAATIPGI